MSDKASNRTEKYIQKQHEKVEESMVHEENQDYNLEKQTKIDSIANPAAFDNNYYDLPLEFQKRNPEEECRPSDEQGESGNKDISDEGNMLVEQLHELRASVFRLLRHAVLEASVKPEDTIKAIEQAVPALYNARSVSLLHQDEVGLWKSCNLLTALVHPATNESLWIAEQIELDKKNRIESKTVCEPSAVACQYRRQLFTVVSFLFIMVLIFIITQAYVIVLSDTLRNFDDSTTQLASFQTQMNEYEQQVLNIKTSGAAIPSGTNKPPENSDSRMEFLETQREWFFQKQIASVDVLLKLMIPPWTYLYVEKQSVSGSNDGISQAIAIQANYLKTIQAPPLARNALQTMVFYVLPLVLGILGSVAYIVRRIVESMANKSFTLNKLRAYGTRIALGALLGVMSGIIVAPNQPQVQAFNLSSIAFAFLMGYSVEFAFSFFDSVVARGRQIFQPDGNKPTKNIAG